MFCTSCGTRLEPGAACGNCPPSGATAAGRGWANMARWVRGGVFRNWTGTVACVICAWFGVPVIVLASGIGAATGAAAGFGSGQFLGDAIVDRLNIFYLYILPLPDFDASELLPTVAWQVGGAWGALVGALHGAWYLGSLAAFTPWQLLYASDPMWPVSIALGQIITAAFLGAVYTTVMLRFERSRLGAGGWAYVPSRRELAALRPIVMQCAQRLGIAAPPEILIRDSADVAMTVGARHLVISTGLVEHHRHHPDRLAAAITHSLALWHSGAPVAALWNQGVAMPLFIAYEIASRMLTATTNVRARPLSFMIRVLLWPFLVTTRWFVAPVHRTYWRRCVLAADAATARAGLAEPLREVIATEDHDGAETAVTHWDRAMMAAPRPERRLDRLEPFAAAPNWWAAFGAREVRT